MSPTVKAIAYGVVSLAAFILFAVGLNNALNGAPGGYHTKSDAPTLADALTTLRWRDIRGWLRDWWDWDAPAWLWYPADAIAHWHPWRTLQIGVWTRQLRTDWRLRPAVTDLREPAAASAPGEGTAPDVLSTVQGAVPLEVRAGKQPWLTMPQDRLEDRYLS